MGLVFLGRYVNASLFGAYSISLTTSRTSSPCSKPVALSVPAIALLVYGIVVFNISTFVYTVVKDLSLLLVIGFPFLSSALLPPALGASTKFESKIATFTPLPSNFPSLTPATSPLVSLVSLGILAPEYPLF